MACVPTPTDTHHAAVAGSTSTSPSDDVPTSARALATLVSRLTTDGDGNLTEFPSRADEPLVLEGGRYSTSQTPSAMTSLSTRVCLQLGAAVPASQLQPSSLSAVLPSGRGYIARHIAAYSFVAAIHVSDESVSLMTIASELAPSAVILQARTSQGLESRDGPHEWLGPLLGGLLGGFFGFILVVAGLWFLWRQRHSIFNRKDSSEDGRGSAAADYKREDRAERGASRAPSPAPTPQPYEYGLVGRPVSGLSSSSSRPSLAHTNSHPHSLQTNSSPPPSASASTSAHMQMYTATGATPPPGAGTGLSPGPSLAPSSRASTPGMGYPFPLQQYRHELQQQQQQGRLSWPRYGGSEDGHDERRSPVSRPQSERRPSRLSLTLANWNPETDGNLEHMREGGGGTGGMEGGMDGKNAQSTVRRASTDVRVGEPDTWLSAKAVDPGASSQTSGTASNTPT
ncbi:hypothetical protein AcV5_002113 [Taiwanofungus camphoratus]|nr:hypothetical protein AcV5_002113 [Antrodia cinnamomea]